MDLLPGLDARWVTHRGTRIRLFDGGDGPPLLLVHGYGGAAWNFSELAPLLPRRRLLIPDLPGHAASARLPAAPTMAAYADAVAACLDDGPVDGFGHSMGGVVALRLAERRPVLVLWGGRDRQVPLSDGFEYARRLRAPIRVIADCGHLLISERPEVCARATLDFLR